MSRLSVCPVDQYFCILMRGVILSAPLAPNNDDAFSGYYRFSDDVYEILFMILVNLKMQKQIKLNFLRI